MSVPLDATGWKAEQALREWDAKRLGSANDMTINQEQKQALQQNWEQVKTQVQASFPGVTEDDLQDANSAPDRIAQRTGQDRNQVEQQLSTIAQQYQ